MFVYLLDALVSHLVGQACGSCGLVNDFHHDADFRRVVRAGERGGHVEHEVLVLLDVFVVQADFGELAFLDELLVEQGFEGHVNVFLHVFNQHHRACFHGELQFLHVLVGRGGHGLQLDQIPLQHVGHLLLDEGVGLVLGVDGERELLGVVHDHRVFDREFVGGQFGLGPGLHLDRVAQGGLQVDSFRLQDAFALQHVLPQFDLAVPESFGEGSQVTQNSTRNQHISFHVFDEVVLLLGVVYPILFLVGQAFRQTRGNAQSFFVEIHFVLQFGQLVLFFFQIVLELVDFVT